MPPTLQNLHEPRAWGFVGHDLVEKSVVNWRAWRERSPIGELGKDLKEGAPQMQSHPCWKTPRGGRPTNNPSSSSLSLRSIYAGHCFDTAAARLDPAAITALLRRTADV